MTEPAQSLEAHRRHDTAVILHLFYPDMWDGIRSYLSHLGGQFDLFVTAPHEVDLPESSIRASFPEAQIYRFENRGRDIAPFLAVFRAISSLGFAYICKIHTKKSPQLGDGMAWHRDMLEKLLGSPTTVSRVKKAFEKHPDWGLIAPAGHVVPLMSDSYHWGTNAELVLELARSRGIPANDIADLEFSFVAGSMFWFRPQAFSLLSDPGFVIEDFDPEEGKPDGTLAHAVERFFGLVVARSGFKIAECDSREVRLSEVPFQLRLLLRQAQKLDERVQTLSRLVAEKDAAAEWMLADLEQRRRDVDELKRLMTEGAARESDLGSAIAKAQGELGRVSNELSDAQTRESEVQAELARSQDRARLDHTRIEDLTRDLAAVGDQVQAVRAELDAANARSSADDARIQSLTGDLAATSTSLQGVRAELDAALVRIAADDSRIQSLTGELTATNSHLQSVQAELDEARNRIVGDGARITSLTGKVAAAADRVHHVTAELEQARGRIAADEARLNGLNGELAAVRQQLQDVLASASWRWTAPLRKIPGTEFEDQAMRLAIAADNVPVHSEDSQVSIQALRDKHRGQTAWIVGKGPSLVLLSKEHIGEGPVIAINDAIIALEALGLDNPLYSMQKDADAYEYDGSGALVPRSTGQSFIPIKQAALLVHLHESSEKMKDYSPRYVFDNVADFGLEWWEFSSLVAAAIARLMGCSKVAYVSHDACVFADFRTCTPQDDGAFRVAVDAYAVGDYPQHRARIDHYLAKVSMPVEWLTPQPGHASLASAAGQSEREVQRLTAELAQSEGEGHRLAVALAQRESELQRVADELALVKSGRAMERAEFESVTKQIDAIGLKLRGAQAEIASLSSRTASLRGELEAAEDHVRTLQSSRSWRWMTPFRKAHEMLTRTKR